MIGDRGGGRERRDPLGAGVDAGTPRRLVGRVAQRLDAAGGRAGPDGDERPCSGAERHDLGGLLLGAHGALDEEDVVGAVRAGRPRLGELDDVEAAEDREQLVLEVQEGQLASVAGRELHHPDARPGGGVHHRPSRPKRSPSSETAKTGPSRQMKKGPIWQWPHRPMPHSMWRSSETNVRSGWMPPARRAATVASIIRSGPTTKAAAGRSRQSRWSRSWVTIPTRPSHSEIGRAHV